MEKITIDISPENWEYATPKRLTVFKGSKPAFGWKLKNKEGTYFVAIATRPDMGYTAVLFKLGKKDPDPLMSSGGCDCGYTALATLERRVNEILKDLYQIELLGKGWLKKEAEEDETH